jgi:hypothetical protein
MQTDNILYSRSHVNDLIWLVTIEGDEKKISTDEYIVVFF